MMKKTISLTFGLLMTMVTQGQNSTVVDTLTPAQDSVPIGSYTESAVAKISDGSVTKAESDSTYMWNDYVSATQIYKNLLEEGEATEIYYNLGSSYYKADDIAKVILDYERALLLQPGNTDIHASLEIARSKTIDKIVSMPDIFFVAQTKSLINCLSVDAWAKLGIVFFILLPISSFLFFLFKQIVRKKSGFMAGIVFLFLVVLSSILAPEQKSELVNRNKATILSPNATVWSTLSESGISLSILHEGHKTEVKDNSVREWKEVRLEDGKVRWVPTSAVEAI